MRNAVTLEHIADSKDSKDWCEWCNHKVNHKDWHGPVPYRYTKMLVRTICVCKECLEHSLKERGLIY